MVVLGNVVFKEGFNAFGMTDSLRHLLHAALLPVGICAERGQAFGAFLLIHFPLVVIDETVIGGIFIGTRPGGPSAERGLGLAAFHMKHCAFVVLAESLMSRIVRGGHL